MQKRKCLLLVLPLRCPCWYVSPRPGGLQKPLLIIWQVLYTLIYVIPFYLSSTTRPSPQLSRDAPSVIRGRIRSVTISCIIVCTSSFILLSSVKNGDPIKTLHSMGIFPVGLVETVKCVALTAILFVGPLFEAGIAEGQWRDWVRLRGLSALKGLIPYRNIVAVS